MTLTATIPTLSICIPTYNRADLLEYCLNNLRALDAQNLDYEVVVLNHASTDGTAELLHGMQKEWPRLRVYHQNKPVSLAGQCVAALRLARGEFTMMLADDDKLIADTLVECVRYMQQHPKIVATYAPWFAYDDAAEKPLHGYFQIAQRIEFTAGQEFALFKFMAERIMYPEIAVFRNQSLQRVTFTHADGASHNALWMLELLKHGTVLFQPDIFYLEVAVLKPQFVRPSRINLDMTLTYLDNTRASLEMMAMRVIQASGGDIISADSRLGIHEILLSYLLGRLEVAFNRALGSGDFLMASELAQRIMLWRGPFLPDFAQMGQQALFGAGVQQIGWLLESMSWKEELVIYDFSPSEPIEQILRLRYPDIKLRMLDAQTIRDTVNPEKALLMVRHTRQKAEFADLFLPGHMVSLEETIEYRKIFPMPYSLAAA
ncbi:MAG: glycosyltransferase family A protein [Alphaproteobacteria bacterium]|nr:glycosyltransferase family A protein [Alphaproteobacteria bacterium]